MTNYEINWQAMAPGPYLSEKYEWPLDMSDSDVSCNSSPVDSNSMGSYQSSPTDTTWDYIPLVEKALGSMPMDELFPEPNLGNHQELLNYGYCDNPLESKNGMSLDFIADINNFVLPDAVDPMSNEDTTRFDLTQFLCEDMNQDIDVKVCKVERFQDEEVPSPSQPMLQVKLEETQVQEVRPNRPIKLEEVDSETEIDVESVPDDFKPFFHSVDQFQPSKGKYEKAKEKCLRKVSKRPTKPKLIKKEQKIVPPMKTMPIGKKDLKQFTRSSSVSSITSTDPKKGVEYKKNVIGAPEKNITHGVVDKIAPPAIIEASDGIGLLDQLEMFDLQMNQDGTKTKKPLAKHAPQRRTIAVEALPQSKRSKGKESRKLKEAQKTMPESKDAQLVEVKKEVIVEPQRQNAQSTKPTSYKIIVDTKTECEKKKVIAQPIRTLKEIPVINPQDWLYTPQKVSTVPSKQKPPIAKLKLVRSLPESQKASGQQISAAVLQQLQEKTKNKKIIVTQMLPVWKVEKPAKPAIQTPQKTIFRSQTMHHNTRPIQPIAQVRAPVPKVSRAVEISTQTEPEKPVEAKKVLQPMPSKKPGCWQVDHDYLNGASLVKSNYKPPMVSILKANVNKIKAQNDLAQKKKAVQDKQEIVQVKRKLDNTHEVQPKKILKLEDYKQRRPIPIVKPQIREEPIIENITLAPFVPPSLIPIDQPAAAVAQEHPYVAPRPIPSHLQMKVSRGVNTSQSWAHLEQMAKNHGLQFSCNSLISSMLEQLPENDISDKIFEDVVVTFAERKKEKVETCEVGTQVGTVKSRSRSQSPARSTFGIQKTLGRGWGNKARTFKDILDSVMERRVVFVGGIREGTTNAQLANMFVGFGEVEHTNIIYEKKWQDGPDYCGFVTFKKADIAYDVISSGNLYQGLEHFQLNFGGRRLFLQTPGYSDLDNMKDDEIYVKEEEQYEESFAESLRIAHRMLKKQGKIS